MISQADFPSQEYKPFPNAWLYSVRDAPHRNCTCSQSGTFPCATLAGAKPHADSCGSGLLNASTLNLRNHHSGLCLLPDASSRKRCPFRNYSLEAFSRSRMDWVRTQRASFLSDRTFLHPPHRTRRASFPCTRLSIILHPVGFVSGISLCFAGCVLLYVL